MTINIDIIDQSTRGSAYDWQRIAAALQEQVRSHVSGPWGMGNSATVRVRTKPLRGHWPVYLLDDSDIAGALGYHETDPGSPILPIGKVFVKTDEKYGLEPSVTLSHEVVEIIGDPMAQLTFQATATQFWALELCDPCEADALAYETPKFPGVLLSDFVLPQWFFGGPGPFTYRQTIPTFRTLAKGGYQAYMDTKTGKWTMVNARSEMMKISRSRTMGTRGRLPVRQELQDWAEAVPQPMVALPVDSV